jgi:IS5 family transposase
VARCCEESERLIDELYLKSERTVKPRTYRVVARKTYLAIAKKRKKNKGVIRTALGKQLRYLRRNLRTIVWLFSQSRVGG